MPPRTTFALADRQKDSCLHPSRPKRNIIQKEKAGNAPSLAHEKGHRQTDRQTHRQTTTTLIASGPPLRGDPYFVCISTTLLRNKCSDTPVMAVVVAGPIHRAWVTYSSGHATLQSGSRLWISLLISCFDSASPERLVNGWACDD